MLISNWPQVLIYFIYTCLVFNIIFKGTIEVKIKKKYIFITLAIVHKYTF